MINQETGLMRQYLKGENPVPGYNFNNHIQLFSPS